MKKQRADSIDAPAGVDVVVVGVKMQLEQVLVRLAVAVQTTGTSDADAVRDLIVRRHAFEVGNHEFARAFALVH